jgi:hypothetical protein
MPYVVRVRSRGYKFVNYFEKKPTAERFATKNRAGKKRADKGVSVTVRRVKRMR